VVGVWVLFFIVCGVLYAGVRHILQSEPEPKERSLTRTASAKNLHAHTMQIVVWPVFFVGIQCVLFTLWYFAH
jgi:hypothetical protein